MKRLIKYDNKTDYVFNDGKIITPKIMIQKHPAVYLPGFYIEVNDVVFYGYHNINVLRSRYNIDEGLTEEEAVTVIEGILNNPYAIMPTAEERIAAALELQNIMNMEDVIL